jgi:hypothetical protein
MIMNELEEIKAHGKCNSPRAVAMEWFYVLGIILIFTSTISTAQVKVNLVINPSFENLYGCPSSTSQIDSTIGWTTLLGGGGGNPDVYNVCCTVPFACGVPTQTEFNSTQYPHSGKGYVGIDGVNGSNPGNFREYIQSKLLSTLSINHSYCVTVYTSLADPCNAYISTLGAYFDNGSISAPSYFGLAIATPQIVNLTQPLNDKINWMKIENSFIASGNEQYISIGNFFPDTTCGLVLLGTPSYWYAYYYIDDVSVIDIDTPAKIGKDHIVYLIPGDSAFIGRTPEVGLNEDCIWSVDGNAIDTIAGLWVKPLVDTKYKLVQNICGNIKSDSVLIIMSGAGINQNEKEKNWVKLFPNPTSDILNIECNNEINEISITDETGKLLKYSSVKNTTAAIDISNFPLGIYFIKIRSENTCGVRKFLKE